MTTVLSMRQLAQIACTMLEADHNATVCDIADRVGICHNLVSRHWHETRPGVRTSRASRRFVRLCGVAYARLTEPATYAEIYADTLSRVPGLHERRMYRAISALIADGRVTASGSRGHQVYARSAR